MAKPPSYVNVTELTEVWIVGQVIEHDSNEGSESFWRLLGIFTDRALAERNCSLTNHFIGPVQINQLVDLSADWPRAVFPLRPQL
jgi:hypothetical protein